MRLPAFICATVVALAVSVAAASFDLASLPDLQQGKYKVGPYITAAARLQDLGRDSACRILLQAAQTNRESKQIMVLCRMLFTQRLASEFRRPRIGAGRFLGGTDFHDWPLEPIELVDAVPFLITKGYNLGGLAELSDDYLCYCMTDCDWNIVRFHEPAVEQKNDALAKLVSSSKWKRPLDSDEVGFLSAQIE